MEKAPFDRSVKFRSSITPPLLSAGRIEQESLFSGELFSDVPVGFQVPHFQ